MIRIEPPAPGSTRYFSLQVQQFQRFFAFGPRTFHYYPGHSPITVGKSETVYFCPMGRSHLFCAMCDFLSLFLTSSSQFHAGVLSHFLPESERHEAILYSILILDSKKPPPDKGDGCFASQLNAIKNAPSKAASHIFACLEGSVSIRTFVSLLFLFQPSPTAASPEDRCSCRLPAVWRICSHRPSEYRRRSDCSQSTASHKCPSPRL